jgi:hypothetical protein
MENFKNLSETEIQEINGGSELSDMIWYGIGYVAHAIYHFGQIASVGHNATWADK